MKTRIFECCHCHVRQTVSMGNFIPCPKCRVGMQDVTDRAVYTVECSHCHIRIQASIGAFNIACPKCKVIMYRVN